MSDAPLLRLVDVACTRGGVAVLAGVSLTLAPGRALLVTGPNGVGKTTLLRCVAGLQPVAAGRIEGPGEGCAYAAHGDGTKPALTVAETLRFWAAIYGGRSGVAAALEAMDLGALAGRPAGMLSAGQKRRLALARLLVAGRRLWVLDEPTVALDGASVARFAGVLRGHLAAGGAALVASHVQIGLEEAGRLDLGAFRAGVESSAFDGAFL